MMIVKWIKQLLEGTPESMVAKLTEDELELLRHLVKVGRPLYEIAAAIEKSEVRTKYEVNKVRRELDNEQDKLESKGQR